MRRHDDCSLTPSQQRRVRAEAARALARGGALGRFPTPVNDIVAASDMREIAEDVLNERFLIGLRKKAGTALKRALGKVLGLFDARSRLIFIDRTLLVVKQAFVRLHEAGHGILPWHRDLYAAIEDSQHSINPETADLFDREANAFASEVLFQLDGFSTEAETHDFGILVPVRLSKKYGASIYAAVRRYVSNNDRACAVLVLDPPAARDADGFSCNLRRVVVSSRFSEIFGSIDWPESFTPSDRIGAMVPVGGRRMSGRRLVELTDRNGDHRECIAEAFTQTHQVFILIHATEALMPTSILLSSGIA